MWLFTKHGFISIVQHKDKPDCVLVRARSEDHLSRIRLAALAPASPEITHTPNADYAYRMEVPKQEWAAAMQRLSEDIDYPNFKNACHKAGDKDWDRTLMDVWNIMREYQERDNR